MVDLHVFAALLRSKRLLFSVCALLCFSSTCFSEELNLSDIKLPPGFNIEIFSSDVPGARSMTLGEKRTLFIGTRDQGKVYAIVPGKGAKEKPKVITIASGLNMPNGVAFRNGSLYVAEINRVLRFDNIESNLRNPPLPVVVNDSFPTETSHGWKFIRFGPDGKLYVPVGAPCNVCERKDQRFATIMRMNHDGTGLQVFASGVRNSVGFDWHPHTNELWFTDNGRDRLGENTPPDELNRAAIAGQHFGFPHLHGRSVVDPKYGKGQKKDKFILPEIELGPHVAALGMRFYTGNTFPAHYRNQIFIAEHGSWNRDDPLGYRVTVVRLKNGKAVAYEIFAEGWLQKGAAWGRPVDLQVMPDGSLLVSDDKAGSIYRISYRKK